VLSPLAVRRPRHSRRAPLRCFHPAAGRRPTRGDDMVHGSGGRVRGGVSPSQRDRRCPPPTISTSALLGLDPTVATQLVDGHATPGLAACAGVPGDCRCGMRCDFTASPGTRDHGERLRARRSVLGVRHDVIAAEWTRQSMSMRCGRVRCTAGATPPQGGGRGSRDVTRRAERTYGH